MRTIRGAKLAQVFKVLGGSKKRYAQLGEIVVVSIKTAEPRKTVKKKKSITLWWSGRKTLSEGKDGSYVRFDETPSCFLDKAKHEPLGEEFSGRFQREIQEKGYNQIISLAPEVV